MRAAAACPRRAPAGRPARGSAPRTAWGGGHTSCNSQTILAIAQQGASRGGGTFRRSLPAPSQGTKGCSAVARAVTCAAVRAACCARLVPEGREDVGHVGQPLPEGQVVQVEQRGAPVQLQLAAGGSNLQEKLPPRGQTPLRRTRFLGSTDTPDRLNSGRLACSPATLLNAHSQGREAAQHAGGARWAASQHAGRRGTTNEHIRAPSHRRLDLPLHCQLFTGHLALRQHKRGARGSPPALPAPQRQLCREKAAVSQVGASILSP